MSKSKKTTFLEDVATFAKAPVEWKQSTYKGGPNKGKPCMRNADGKVRAMTPEEEYRYHPENAYDLNDPVQVRILADYHEDRQHKGDDERAHALRQQARKLEVRDAVRGAMRHLLLNVPVAGARTLFAQDDSGALMPRIDLERLLAEVRSRWPEGHLQGDEFLDEIADRRQANHVHVTENSGYLYGIPFRPLLSLDRQQKVEPRTHWDYDFHPEVSDVIRRHLASQGSVSLAPASTLADVSQMVRRDLPGLSDPEVLDHLARMYFAGSLRRTGNRPADWRYGP